MGKTVGINAHLLAGNAGYRQAGIHHYIKQLINHLPQNPHLNYTVFSGEGSDVHLPATVKHVSTRLSTETPPVRIAWEQLLWPLENKRHNIDLIHSMAFVTPLINRIPSLVTIYDLSFVHFPDRFTRFKRLYLQKMTRFSCQRATRIVTIAEDGRQDVHRVFGVPLEKIDVVYPGVGTEFYPLPDAEIEAFKREQGLEKPFLLHVGTLQPRKNITTLIEAFAQLPDENLELVLVGGKGWLYDDIFGRIQALNLTNRVRFPGYVPDEQLPLWYNAATVFVFPSVYEGFGMPVAHAMACGTPVITSNASSLPEVVGDAGLLFDPQDVSALTGLIGRLLHDHTLQATLREKGLQQARNFSWIQSGAKMASIYQHVCQVVQ